MWLAMRTRWLRWLAGIGLVGLVALGWWSVHPGPKPQKTAVAMPQDASAGAAAPHIANAPAASAPLPAQGTPLRLVFDDLKRRAGTGDARAACRLAAELEQCERVRMQLAQFDDQMGSRRHTQEVVAGNPEETARRKDMMERLLAKRGQRLLEASEQCDGVPAISPAQRADLWRAAALGGSLPALTQYAVGNAFRLRDTLKLLPQLQVYRNEAESLALRAAQRGSLPATLALAGAYSPQRESGRRTYLAQVVTPDPARSLALYLRAQQALGNTPTDQTQARRRRFRDTMFERNIDWLRANMSPDQMAQADALSRQWQQQWTPVPPEETRGTFSMDGGVSDIAPARCGD